MPSSSFRQHLELTCEQSVLMWNVVRTHVTCSFITDCKSHCVLLLAEEQRKCHLRLSIKCITTALSSSGGGH